MAFDLSERKLAPELSSILRTWSKCAEALIHYAGDGIQRVVKQFKLLEKRRKFKKKILASILYPALRINHWWPKSQKENPPSFY